MDSKVKAEVVDGKISFQFTNSSETNTLELLGSSSQEVLTALHLSGGSKLTATDKIESSSAVEATDLATSKPAGEVLAGSSMKFTFNGTTATITSPLSLLRVTAIRFLSTPARSMWLARAAFSVSTEAHPTVSIRAKLWATCMVPIR